jgi:outer membrane lipoprotein-sorting protein
MSIASSVSSSGRRKVLVWGVPVIVTGAVIAAAAISNATASSASPSLPSRTPTQLLVAVQQHADTSLSGTVKQTANLGLPSLPDSGSRASLSWQTFLTGTHEVRLWVDGPDKQRAALIGQLSEADAVHNGRNLWTYTSQSNSVSHTVLRSSNDNAESDTYNPTTAAADLLKAVGPSTAVTVDSAQTVAGRAAYTLVLTPRDKNSTVRKATIAIDAKKYVPLEVAVYGSGSQAAFKIGFSSVSFAKPKASVFDFRVPAGASVTTDPVGLKSDGHHHGNRMKPLRTAPTTHSAAPTTIGSAWTTVLELHGLPSGADSVLGSSTIRDLTSKVGSGGERLLHTSLLNAVFLPDGRVFVGAVQPAALEHVAATTPH